MVTSEKPLSSSREEDSCEIKTYLLDLQPGPYFPIILVKVTVDNPF